MELKANQYFNNRYMLIQCMGEGASAQVWKAVDLQANNLPVALKVFSATGVMDTAGIQNFKHEFTSVFNFLESDSLSSSSLNTKSCLSLAAKSDSFSKYTFPSESGSPDVSM